MLKGKMFDEPLCPLKIKSVCSFFSSSLYLLSHLFLLLIIHTSHYSSHEVGPIFFLYYLILQSFIMSIDLYCFCVINIENVLSIFEVGESKCPTSCIDVPKNDGPATEPVTGSRKRKARKHCITRISVLDEGTH